MPQPGLLDRRRLRPDGSCRRPTLWSSNAEEFWSEDWKAYGTYEDTFYGAPLMASIKGYVMLAISGAP